MIIQCPNCSTGFNLPDKHITSKGAKLRCSRCSHVFRVRRDSPDEEIEFFYKPEDEKANAELAASEQGESGGQEAEHIPAGGDGLGAEESLAIELGADFEALLNSAATPEERAASAPEEPTTSEPASAPEPEVTSSVPEEPDPSKRTQIGLPGVSTHEPATPDLSGYGFGSSSSSKESEDPFPLAGGSLKNLKSKIKINVPKPGAPASSPGTGLSGSSVTEEPEPEQAESPTAGIDLFGDELGGTDLAQEDPFAGAFQEDSLDPQSFVEDSAAIAESASAPPVEETPILHPGQPAAPAAFEAPQPQAAALPTPEPAPAPAPSLGEPAMLQANSGGAFVDAGDLVDPSFGSQGASFDPQQGVVAQPALAPQPVAPQPAARPVAQQAPRPVAQQVAATPAPAKVAPAADIEDSWPTQADAIAAHRIGGGGAQKVANFFLIMLFVLVSFLGLVAGLNDGMLDFKQFGSMIEVAFSDGEYKPREEWIPKAKPQPKAAMESPLRTESVWAEIVPFGKKKKQRVLVVRGLLRNFDQQDYLDVELRGIVLDGKERIKAEKVVPLGALISNDKIAASSVLDDFGAMLPQSAPPLKVASSEPFTIFFDDIPEEVTAGEPIFFRVDVAKKTGRDGVANP